MYIRTNNRHRGRLILQGHHRYAQDHEMRKHHVLFARQSVALLAIEEPRGLYTVLDTILVLSIDEIKLHLVLAKMDIRVFEHFK